MVEERGPWGTSFDPSLSAGAVSTVTPAAAPAGPEMLFARAVRLQRDGDVDEARAAIAQLAEMYEARGQHTQALRILRMLGDPEPDNSVPAEANGHAVAPAADAPAGRLATEVVPAPADPLPGQKAAVSDPSGAGPAAADSPATDLLSRRTRGLAGMAERSTALLRTASLQTPATPRRTAGKNPFLPSTLTFTVPLPGEAALPDRLRKIVAESGQHLHEGRLEAAIDGCLQVLALDGTYLPVSARIAEILTVRQRIGRARAEAETVLRLMAMTGQREHRWMAERVLLHTNGRDRAALQTLIQHLIEAKQSDQASFYASRQIRLLDDEGLTDEAWSAVVHFSDQMPADARLMIEQIALCLKASEGEAAKSCLDTAFAIGTDPVVVQVARAVTIAASDEEFHWRELADVMPLARSDVVRAEMLHDAYSRLAAVMPADPTLEAGQSLLLAVTIPEAGLPHLATMVMRVGATPMTRAVAAVTLAQAYGGEATDERVKILRAALSVLDEPGIADHPAWIGLTGSLPRIEDISLDLGEALLDQDDVPGAIEVLEAAQQRSPCHEILCQRLADAYFRHGQLRDALEILDALVSHYRDEGQLEAMVVVLRRMAEMAPNNAKVKAYLIDAFLQRGFVAEARTEIVELADLDQRAGRITGATANLKRAADLDWTIGQADQAFALYERLVALMPDQTEHRYALVTLYLQMGRMADAAIHQRAIADQCLALGRTREAIAALHQLIGLMPTDPCAYQELGTALRLAGEYEQADRIAQRMLAISADNPALSGQAEGYSARHSA